VASNDDRLRQLQVTVDSTRSILTSKTADQNLVAAFNTAAQTVNDLAYNIFTKKLSWNDKRLGVLKTLESQINSYYSSIASAPEIIKPTIIPQILPTTAQLPATAVAEEVYISRTLPSGEVVLEPQDWFNRYKYFVAGGVILLVGFVLMRKS